MSITNVRVDLFELDSIPRSRIIDFLDYSAAKNLRYTCKETRLMTEKNLSDKAIGRFAQEILEVNTISLEFVPQKCKENRKFVCNAVAVNGFNTVPEKFQDDLTVLKIAFTAQLFSKRAVDELLKQKLLDLGAKKFIESLAKTNFGISHTDRRWKYEQLGLLYRLGVDCDCLVFQDDREVVFATVEQYGEYLRYVSEQLRDDEEFVRAAVRKNGLALKYASERLQDNEDLVHIALKQNGLVLQYASERLRNSEVFVRLALEQKGLALQYASKKLQDNEDLVRLSLKQDGLAFQHVSGRLRKNRILLRLALEQNGLALQYSGWLMRDNETFVCLALEQNGLALEYASERLQDKKPLVLVALEQNGLALQYASERLQNKESVARVAMKKIGSAFEYVGEKLRKNEEILALLQTYRRTISEKFPFI